jgi:hypothetical protein
MEKLIQINAEELRKALKDIEGAEKHGFMFCEAVFTQSDRDNVWAVGKYSDMWEKAALDNSSLDWGRGQSVTKDNYFKDGKVIPTKEKMDIIDNFPKSSAIETGKIGKIDYYIVEYRGSLNGYVVFPKRPVVENGYDGIMTYIPVHGGITYATQKKFGMVYGFDTKHSDSNDFPINDKKWIKKECEKMINGILMAEKVEKKYLTAKSNETKRKYAQMVLDTDKGGKNQYNFGIGIKMLRGEL